MVSFSNIYFFFNINGFIILNFLKYEKVTGSLNYGI